jgi:hypothetical protein
MKKLKFLLVQFLNRKVADGTLPRTVEPEFVLRTLNKFEHAVLTGDRKQAIRAADVLSKLITKVIGL